MSNEKKGEKKNENKKRARENKKRKKETAPVGQPATKQS
jgi:hypothetical protein